MKKVIKWITETNVLLKQIHTEIRKGEEEKKEGNMHVYTFTLKLQTSDLSEH